MVSERKNTYATAYTVINAQGQTPNPMKSKQGVSQQQKLKKKPVKEASGKSENRKLECRINDWERIRNCRCDGGEEGRDSLRAGNKVEGEYGPSTRKWL